MQDALEIEHIRALLAPALRGAGIPSVRAVDGGLVNRIYRVAPAGGKEVLAMRVYFSGTEARDRERRVLERIGASIPTPDIVFASDRSTDFPYPFVVYRWIEGVTLNECRRNEPTSVLESLAEPLGRLAARVASVQPSADLPERLAVDAIAEADERLSHGRARNRVGASLADRARARFNALQSRLARVDAVCGLAHGDFSGRNILVARDAAGWRIAGLLDWEQAFAGATLWDVGSLFRYTHRYSAMFRRRFESGYRDAGGALASDWHDAARSLDATRVVAILDEDRDLPGVFDECRELIGALVNED